MNDHHDRLMWLFLRWPGLLSFDPDTVGSALLDFEEFALHLVTVGQGLRLNSRCPLAVQDLGRCGTPKEIKAVTGGAHSSGQEQAHACPALAHPLLGPTRGHGAIGPAWNGRHGSQKRPSDTSSTRSNS